MTKDAWIIVLAILLMLWPLSIIARAAWRYFHRDPWDKLKCTAREQSERGDLL